MTTFFLDVGGWECNSSGEARTPFGLVSGHDAVLCSWLKNHPTEQSGNLITDLNYLGLKGGKAAFKPAPLVKQFLTEAASSQLNSKVLPPNYSRLAVSGRRGFVHKWGRVPMRMTPDDQLLVIIGDLHLQLFAGYPVDLFRYKAPGDSRSRSLDLELRTLLELAGLIKTQSKKDIKTIQAGDMYEIWETEIILRHMYLLFLNLSRRYELGLRSMPSRIPATSLTIPREIVERVIQTGKLPSPPHFHQLISTDNARKRGSLVLTHVDPDRINREGIDFRSTDDICEGIRRQHPYLFGGFYDSDRGLKTNIFDIEIRGNHDNFLSNKYWRDIMKSWAEIDPQLRKYDKNNFFRMPTKSASGKHDFYSNLGTPAGSGQDNRIWVEHGHAYDWHNNNSDWWCRKHGFDIVYAYLYDAFLGKIRLTKWHPLGSSFARSVANLIVDASNYEMRLPELERAMDLEGGVGGVAFASLRLIVMGHTHKPYLSTLGYLWDEKEKEYNDYFYSDKRLKSCDRERIRKEYGMR